MAYGINLCTVPLSKKDLEEMDADLKKVGVKRIGSDSQVDPFVGRLFKFLRMMGLFQDETKKKPAPPALSVFKNNYAESHKVPFKKEDFESNRKKILDDFSKVNSSMGKVVNSECLAYDNEKGLCKERNVAVDTLARHTNQIKQNPGVAGKYLAGHCEKQKQIIEEVTKRLVAGKESTKLYKKNRQVLYKDMAGSYNKASKQYREIRSDLRTQIQQHKKRISQQNVLCDK